MSALTGPGHWWHPDDLDSCRVLLRTAIEAGVDHLDTADAYGPETAEHLIRKALHPYPRHLLIATKGGMTRPGPNRWAPLGRPEYLRQCVALSLRRLRTDHIDLYYLHRIDPLVPLEDQIGALMELRSEGKIAHIGLSKVNLDQLREAQALTTIAAVQNRLNIDDHTSIEVLEHCADTKTAFIAYSPFDQGRTLPTVSRQAGAGQDRGGTRDAGTEPSEQLRWILSHGRHVGVVAGTSSLAHLRANLNAVSR